MITSKLTGVLLALSTVTPITFQVLNNEPPVDIRPIEFDGVARSGAAIAMPLAGKGRSDCPAEVQQSFTDSAGVVTNYSPAEMAFVGVFHGEPQFLRVYVPNDAASGRGVYAVSFIFRCNLVQEALPAVKTYYSTIEVERIPKNE